MWERSLLPATLLKRYKRFLADVRLEDGREMTVHCPNTGAMTGCATPGSKIWLLDSENPKRKYRYTWELVDTGAGLACVHSARANRVLAAALAEKTVAELAPFSAVQAEAPWESGSRVDFMLSGDGSNCFVEVKSVTLLADSGDGRGVFPDAVSSRGRKHLEALERSVDAGDRAVLMFLVMHNGIRSVAPADTIDPAYGLALRKAAASGVEIYARRVTLSPEAIDLGETLPVVLD